MWYNPQIPFHQFTIKHFLRETSLSGASKTDFLPSLGNNVFWSMQLTSLNKGSTKHIQYFIKQGVLRNAISNNFSKKQRRKKLLASVYKEAAQLENRGVVATHVYYSLYYWLPRFVRDELSTDKWKPYIKEKQDVIHFTRWLLWKQSTMNISQAQKEGGKQQTWEVNKEIIGVSDYYDSNHNQVNLYWLMASMWTNHSWEANSTDNIN